MQNRKWNYCRVTWQPVIFVSLSLTFNEVRLLKNQNIKKIKKIKKSKVWLFDYLVAFTFNLGFISDDSEVLSASSLKLLFWLIMSCFIEGQWDSDKDNRLSGHMTIISFPVLYSCRNALKRAKTTLFKCKDDEIIK